MKSTVRFASELGDDLVLAPERWVAALDFGRGVPLGDLVVERRERARDTDAAVILDTTHAKDGIVDVASALRGGPPAKSAKKTARVGDLIVSRLRPYLRQIALVHPAAVASFGGRALALSTEFYVLAPRAEVDLAFLLPFLLGAPVQSALAAAQEGGHHPRVPRGSLLALRVPESLVEARARLSLEVNAALAELYAASARYR